MKSNLSAVQRTVLYTVTQEYGVDRPIVYCNNKTKRIAITADKWLLLTYYSHLSFQYSLLLYVYILYNQT